MEHIQHVHVNWTSFVLLMLFFVAFTAYTAAVARSNLHYKPWPMSRYICWIIGMLTAVSAVFGPLALLAHTNFSAHMVCHLLLGMISPLFVALSTPISLLLRTLKVNSARRFVRFLKCRPLRFVSHPLTASVLNVGGLWALYTTNIYRDMHQYPILYLVIHVHIWLAGLFFTVSIIYLDPPSHRHSFIFRAGVFVLAFSAHAILSKYIYVHSPAGVTQEQAEIGGMVMYYGGDVVEIALICVFCWQWFRRSKVLRY
ncbi:cytochrome c oxidase assembly protein [Paenibacillus nanensis]|uniref:Cytochrome c oxidase assembly protein n=2 Tax=Paenibacillus nanensis TaxID=393251 RepID=A0A3A1UYD2_9BACL|nr:cytochrome c oxidase assembly protein [Paenibacillus nanensis]